MNPYIIIIITTSTTITGLLDGRYGWYIGHRRRRIYPYIITGFFFSAAGSAAGALYNIVINMGTYKRKTTYSRHDDTFNVSEDGVPIFAQLGRLLRQQVSNVAWLNVGENASLADVLQVVGDIIHHLLAYYSSKIREERTILNR